MWKCSATEQGGCSGAAEREQEESRERARVHLECSRSTAGREQGHSRGAAGAQERCSRAHSPLCSPATESTALPPLSEPTLPPCSAGDVRSVEPSVAAVLPSSSEAGAKRIKRAVTSKNTAWEQLQTTLTLPGKGCGEWALGLGTATKGRGAWG